MPLWLALAVAAVAGFFYRPGGGLQFLPEHGHGMAARVIPAARIGVGSGIPLTAFFCLRAPHVRRNDFLFPESGQQLIMPAPQSITPDLPFRGTHAHVRSDRPDFQPFQRELKP